MDASRERIEAALAVLRAAGEVDDSAGERWRLAQLEGGWSRHTYLLSAPADGDELRYIVRVKPPGAILASDLVREYWTYAALSALPVPAPRVYGVEPSEETPFGGAFFVQEWKPGDGPNVWRRRDRERLEENWRTSRTIAIDFVTALGAVHGAPTDRFAFLGAREGFDEVVRRWRETYEEMRLVRDPVVDEAFEWVAGRRPARERFGLVHGDYRTGNMLIESGRVTAVVDWELAYLGDTQFDLGYLSLAYLSGKFVLPGSSLACAVADRDWLFEEYERLTGTPVDREAVRTYSALGALMLIAIFTTGIRMYATGKTNDLRMAWNRFVVPGLRQDLTRLMGW